MKRMADNSVAGPPVPRKKRKKTFSRRLKLSVNGKARSFYEWTKDYAETHYPNIGSSTYRVPPLYFNHQNVVIQTDTTRNTNILSESVPVKAGRVKLASEDKGNIDCVRPNDNEVSPTNEQENLHIEIISDSSEDDDSGASSGSETSSAVSDAYHSTTSARSTENKDATQLVEGTQKEITAPSKAPTHHKVSLMRPPEDTLARRDKALSRVLDAFEYLGRELERSGVEGLFMVSGVSYENYLNRLPKKVTQNFEVPRPQDVATRGELDILILHPNAGILLVQVKSVGENLAAWKASDEDAAKAIKKVLIKAAGMTGRDEAVFKHILQDLDPVPTFTKVVALPFVSRSEFEKAMTQKDDLTSTCRLFLTDMKIVCKDEIEDTVELCNSESMVKHIPIPKQIEYSSHESGMLRWWHQTFLRNGSRLNLDHLKTIVGRVCGLLSSLHVQPDSKSRVEVRTYGQAVSETAERTTAFNLTPTLHRVLGIQDPYVAIVGPPATGKTMLLGMKGRRWREEGRHVVVVNFGPEEAGLPNAHALLEVINSGLKDDVFPKASRMDLALCHIKEDDLTQKINNFIQQFQQSSQHDDPTSVECDKKVCFIVDDLLLLRRMPRVLKFLRDHPISDSVWCSTSGFSEDKRKELMGYKIIVLDNVVRCPITVQALLLKLEKREDWKAAYAKCSVDAGLPTKGPPLVFLHHQQHLLQKQTDASKDLRPGAEDGSDSDENTPAGRVVDGTLDRTGTPHGKELADGAMVQEVTAQNPLQCLECGHDVASFIGTLLKESEKPEHPPLVQSKKPSSEGSKSRSPGVLHYRDVVIVYPLPRKIMPNGIIRMCVSPDELDAHWKSVEASPFVLGVREKGIPVKVVRSQEAREIALQSSEQSVILTDAFIVRSLERKVVIFVPLTQSKSAAEHNDLPNAQENSPAHLSPPHNLTDKHRSGDVASGDPEEDSLTACDLATDADATDDAQQTDKEPQNLHQPAAPGSDASSHFPSTWNTAPSLMERATVSESPEAESERPRSPKDDRPTGAARLSPPPGRSSRPEGHPRPVSPASLSGDLGQRQGSLEAISVDGVVSRLSELNKEAMYRAAACCVAQFVLVVP